MLTMDSGFTHLVCKARIPQAVMLASRRGSRRWYDAADSFYFQSISAFTKMILHKTDTPGIDFFLLNTKHKELSVDPYPQSQRVWSVALSGAQ